MSKDTHDDELPSYEDVIKEEERLQSQPPRPPRPAANLAQGHQSRPHQRPSTMPATSSSQTYAHSHSYTPTSSQPRPPPRPQQNPSLPWTYPPRFYCSKCGNTGYKLKNGRSCKSCWRRFAPQKITLFLHRHITQTIQCPCTPTHGRVIGPCTFNQGILAWVACYVVNAEGPDAPDSCWTKIYVLFVMV